MIMPVQVVGIRLVLEDLVQNVTHLNWSHVLNVAVK
uniref:Uncharacterized protein n=1 Tax=Salmonella phage vB_STmST313_KE31 TaxID=3161181 RepID=A0AAU8GLK3_9CAUD